MKTEKLIKILKGNVENRTPIAADMFLPNHSGTKKDPTQPQEIATKKYVDDNEYTDAEAVAAVAAADVYLKNTGDTATGDYNFDSGTLFIDATNNRIGVRTATPSYAADIQGDTALLLKVARSDSGTTALFSCVSDTTNWGRGEEVSVRQMSNSNNSFSAVGFRSYGGTLTGGLSCVYPTMASHYGKLFLSSRGPSGFQTNNLIVYDGKVGIMNATPSATLDCQGSAIFNDTGADVDFRIEGDTDANLFFVDASADKIGIGKNNPAEKLDVNSSGNTRILVQSSNDAGYPGLAIKKSTQEWRINTDSGRNVRFEDVTGGSVIPFLIEQGAGSNTLVVDTNSRVGIGTASPGKTLDVRGDVVFNEAGGDYDFRVEGDTDANLLFTDASTDRVGIGTSTPAETLDVNGTIKGTGYKSSDGSAGVSGSFTSADGKTITVKDGLITAIV